MVLPGFGCGVCLPGEAGRVARPGGARVGSGSDRAGLVSFPVVGPVRAGQAGAGGVQSRCQQVRNASFQGQLGLIFRTRSREWQARRAGMCQIR